MISFRSHLLTLVAVFFALAVGVVLGGGPLSEVGRAEPGGEDPEQSAAAATDARNADFGSRFAGGVSTTLYAGRLTGREVAVVWLPGADQAVVDALGAQVLAAGGAVSAALPLGPNLVNPGEKALVDTLGSQLVAQLPKDTVTPESTTYERIGQLLGYTLATAKPEGAATTAQSAAVLEGLRGAALVEGAETGQGEIGQRRAPLVLVVLGDEVGGDGGGEGGDDILGGLIRGLSQSAVGVVVAGDTAAADDQLTRLRAATALSTATSVDGVETAPGQVATILGLVRALSVQGGDFGASGADGAVPLG
mgnify:CR=1 FL=1